MIASLIEKGLAYRAANGDVFYAVSKFAGYGKLSGKTLEDLRAGERVEVDTLRKIRWILCCGKLPNRTSRSWDSPWGKGRPGWHIECSAMSADHSGRAF